MLSTTGPPHRPAWQNEFLQRHRLNKTYLAESLKWFAPLTSVFAKHQNSTHRPILVALNGCQGSGKTTVVDFLCTHLAKVHAVHAVALSLDDFYLTVGQRRALAASVHPLLITRGVPGTHDMALLHQTLNALLDTERREPVAIPRFNKAEDDRYPPSGWDRINTPVQIVLLEGWCLGALPQHSDLLLQPLNTLEQNEDPEGRWREYSNTILDTEFRALYARVDQWIMLQAPSFDCVFQWRQEQERKLAASLPSQRTNTLMDDPALHRFIQHYERITRQCLSALPERVNHLFKLTEQREVSAYQHRTDLDGLT